MYFRFNQGVYICVFLIISYLNAPENEYVKIIIISKFDNGGEYLR